MGVIRKGVDGVNSFSHWPIIIDSGSERHRLYNLLDTQLRRGLDPEIDEKRSALSRCAQNGNNNRAAYEEAAKEWSRNAEIVAQPMSGIRWLNVH